MGRVISKRLLETPYNGDLNSFVFELGWYTYLSDEDQIQVFTCLPWYTDPDTSNDWYKVLDEFDPHEP